MYKPIRHWLCISSIVEGWRQFLNRFQLNQSCHPRYARKPNKYPTKKFRGVSHLTIWPITVSNSTRYYPIIFFLWRHPVMNFSVINSLPMVCSLPVFVSLLITHMHVLQFKLYFFVGIFGFLKGLLSFLFTMYRRVDLLRAMMACVRMQRLKFHSFFFFWGGQLRTTL